MGCGRTYRVGVGFNDPGCRDNSRVVLRCITSHRAGDRHTSLETDFFASQNRQIDRKFCSRPELRLNRDFASMKPREVLHYREPQSRPADISRPGAIDTIKAFKNTRYLIAGHSLTGVNNIDVML